MMEITELEVWQTAMNLSQRLYELSKSMPETEQFGLGHQLRQHAVKIPSLIAAAASRKYGQESIRALDIAKGHLYETETVLRLAHRLDLLSEDETKETLEQLETSRKLLFGFLKYYKRATRS